VHVGSRGAAFVSMLKASDLGHGNDGALLGRLNGPGFRTVHVERQVSTGFVVVLDILAKEPSQMILAEDKDVVQAFARRLQRIRSAGRTLGLLTLRW